MGGRGRPRPRRRAGNTSSLAGVVSYDLLLKNASAQTVFVPLAGVVSRLSSGSGGVTVANADNGQAGAGGSGSGTSAGGTATSAGALVTGVLRVTYNPLLRTVSVELLK